MSGYDLLGIGGARGDTAAILHVGVKIVANAVRCWRGSGT